MDDKGVLFRQQRVISSFFGQSIPNDLRTGMEGHVVRNRIGGAISGASNIDIDRFGFVGERSVVPAKGNVVSNFIVRRCCSHSRCEHINTPSW